MSCLQGAITSQQMCALITRFMTSYWLVLCWQHVHVIYGVSKRCSLTSLQTSESLRKRWTYHEHIVCDSLLIVSHHLNYCFQISFMSGYIYKYRGCIMRYHINHAWWQNALAWKTELGQYSKGCLMHTSVSKTCLPCSEVTSFSKHKSAGLSNWDNGCVWWPGSTIKICCISKSIKRTKRAKGCISTCNAVPSKTRYHLICIRSWFEMRKMLWYIMLHPDTFFRNSYAKFSISKKKS